ncbi:MAG: hypothetical protein AAFQ41_00415 [Cyanobacteria bacterium J06623_7]
MTTSFFTPAYIDLIRKTGDRWSKPKVEKILNASGKPYNLQEKYSKHGLTQMDVLKELYRHYQGLDGWYLVHLAEQKYYYCGATPEDVQNKLEELGLKHG